MLLLRCGRNFVCFLAGISVVLHKVVLCRHLLDFSRPTTYFWLPSVFLPWDAVFVGLVWSGLAAAASRSRSMAAAASSGSTSRTTTAQASSSRRRPCCYLGGAIILLLTLPVVVVVVLAVAFTVFAVAANVTGILGHGQMAPWALTVWAWTEWDDFLLLVQAKATESYVQVWMVALIQVVWALLASWGYSYCVVTTKKSAARSTATTTTSSQRQALPLVVSLLSCSHPTTAGTATSRGRRHAGALYPWFLWLLTFYLLLTVTLRPSVPYSKLSQTPCFAVPLEIWEGVQQHRAHHHHQHNQQQQPPSDKNDGNHRLPPVRQQQQQQQQQHDNSESFEPLNVILVFLESSRADIVPFNRSTDWARRFVSAHHGDVTPFYSHWTQLNETLHLPLIKSASGFTHKSLLSALCSMHALPVMGTAEPSYDFYHPCLPQRLGGHPYHYSSVFFQPAVEHWEHERELIGKMGFAEYFGKQSYDNATGASEAFQKAHTANYFGYEDNVMLPVMLKWIYQQHQQKASRPPFFMSYMSGMTHDPYKIPPSIHWKSRFFSENGKVNDFLNTVAYMDQWFERFMGQLEARQLLESTLVVALGDHGIALYDRNDADFTTGDVVYEEAMNVGISFHSRSARWKSILRELDPAEIANGHYSSIDVVPTILEILGIGGERGNNNDNKSNDLVDGISMLHPSGQRLRLSIANPGFTMVLRDRSYVLVRRLWGTPEAFDLRVDPTQTSPVRIDRSLAGSGDTELTRWGVKAAAFLQFLDEDLHWSYGNGQRCSNCTLSMLISLETLEDWNSTMETSRYGMEMYEEESEDYEGQEDYESYVNQEDDA